MTGTWQGRGCLEADRLADEDDVDAARRFLVDLEDLPDAAVLAVCGLGASILERQAVLVDPVMSRAQGRDEFLRADDEDDVGSPPGVGAELAARGRGNHEGSVPGDRVRAAERVIGLPAD